MEQQQQQQSKGEHVLGCIAGGDGPFTRIEQIKHLAVLHSQRLQRVGTVGNRLLSGPVEAERLVVHRDQGLVLYLIGGSVQHRTAGEGEEWTIPPQ